MAPRPKSGGKKPKRSEAKPDRNQDERELYVRIWEKTVDTQMHFNEMSVKSRQLGLTFVAAALGVAIVLMSRGEDFFLYIPEGWPISGRLHVSVLIICAAIVALLAVRTLDVSVYHKMLRGAVTFGEDFEQNYLKKIFSLEKGMTQAISHFSRFQDAKVETKDGRYVYKGEDRRSAEKKIRSFYFWTVISLVGAAVVFLVITIYFTPQPKTKRVEVRQQKTESQLEALPGQTTPNDPARNAAPKK